MRQTARDSHTLSGPDPASEPTRPTRLAKTPALVQHQILIDFFSPRQTLRQSSTAKSTNRQDASWTVSCRLLLRYEIVLDHDFTLIFDNWK